MEPEYSGRRYEENMSVDDSVVWAGLNDTLPILMLEMAHGRPFAPFHQVERADLSPRSKVGAVESCQWHEGLVCVRTL